MKIGIMTFWWLDDNYGQLLQCYALQKYLRDLGHDAFLIRYRYDNDIIRSKPPLIKLLLKAFNPKNVYYYLKGCMERKKRENEETYNDRKFELFRKKYIAQSSKLYLSLKELRNNPPDADIYIVGSDQVWNFWTNFSERINLVHAYLLDFGSDKIKRLSYAASWGRTEISDDEVNVITPLLKRFEYVSVRENSGVELCKKCGYNNAEWVCDPTLLLSAETYRNLYKENGIPPKKQKYVLLYMLGNECDFDIKTAYEFAAKKQLEIIYVSGNSLKDNYPKTIATIPEWLYLVDNAEYIITNSFHCGIFSTIFHKQFGIVLLTGEYAGMNARMQSLFKLRGIEERYIKNGNYDVLDKQYEINKIKISDRFMKICGA